LAVRKSLQASVAATLLSVGILVEGAAGGPAGMAAGGQSAQPVAAATNPPAPPAAPVRVAVLPDRPSDGISPFRHPIKYFAAAISETPVASLLRSKDNAPAAGEIATEVIEPAATVAPRETASAHTPDAMIALAFESEQRGDVPQARRFFQQALAQWPGNADVLRAAARMEDRLEQLPLAENLYRQALAGYPQNPGTLNDLGLCLARQGRLEDSVNVFEQAIQLQPEKALYRNNVATVLVLLRQDKPALAHLSAVHGPAEAQFNMGQILMSRGRQGDAGSYFAAAIEADPNLEAAHAALAQLNGQLLQGQASTAPGAAPNSAAPTTTAPAMVEQRVTPQETTPTAPSAAGQPGPQMVYPSEARLPGLNRSSYVPPAYQPPTGPYPGTTPPAQAVAPFPQPNVPWVGQAPRYLPPTGTAPANVRR
jgi:Tfp pilus assembly protein PilF